MSKNISREYLVYKKGTSIEEIETNKYFTLTHFHNYSKVFQRQIATVMYSMSTFIYTKIEELTQKIGNKNIFEVRENGLTLTSIICFHYNEIPQQEQIVNEIKVVETVTEILTFMLHSNNYAKMTKLAYTIRGISEELHSIIMENMAKQPIDKLFIESYNLTDKEKEIHHIYRHFIKELEIFYVANSHPNVAYKIEALTPTITKVQFYHRASKFHETIIVHDKKVFYLSTYEYIGMEIGNQKDDAVIEISSPQVQALMKKLRNYRTVSANYISLPKVANFPKTPNLGKQMLQRTQRMLQLLKEQLDVSMERNNIITVKFSNGNAELTLCEGEYILEIPPLPQNKYVSVYSFKTAHLTQSEANERLGIVLKLIQTINPSSQKLYEEIKFFQQNYLLAKDLRRKL